MPRLVDQFPYGKAPFWLLCLALLSSVLLVATRRRAAEARPDLMMATFATQHYAAYKSRSSSEVGAGDFAGIGA